MFYCKSISKLIYLKLIHKLTYRARIDSNAIILIIYLGSADHNVRTGANIKPIGVVAAFTITSAVVNCHTVDIQSIGTIDADGLDRGVFDIQISDGGRSEIVSSKELWLRLAAIATLAIPPAGTIRVQNGTTGTLDSDIIAFNLEQRTRPLFIAPGGCSLKDNLQI